MNDTAREREPQDGKQRPAELLRDYVDKVHAAYQETGKQLDRSAVFGLILSLLVITTATDIIAIKGQVTLSTSPKASAFSRLGIQQMVTTDSEAVG